MFWTPGLCFTDLCFCLFVLPVLLWLYSPVTKFTVPLTQLTVHLPIPEDGFLAGGRKEYSGNYMLSSAYLHTDQTGRCGLPQGIPPERLKFSIPPPQLPNFTGERNRSSEMRWILPGWCTLGKWLCCPVCSAAVPQILALLSRHKPLLIYCHKGIFNSMCVIAESHL